MKPLQRCFVFSTYEMRNYCIALILNRALLVLVFIVDYQRSVEMSHGKRRNKHRQENVPANKRIICSYDSAWEEECPVLPYNDNKHAFCCIHYKLTVSCEHSQVREMLIVIVTQNFRKLHTIKMLMQSKCRQNLRFLRSHQAILLKFRKLSITCHSR